jgi:hypothetical protein
MPMRNIVLTFLLTIALFSAITYTACKKDPCENVICMNLGACDGGKCVCPVGFEGARCEVLSRDKLVKTFNGRDTCTSDTTFYGVYPIYFRAMLTDPRELTMKNILNNMEDSAVCTMQGIDTFTFQGSNNSLTYFGTGRVSNDSLWLNYRVERDTSSYTCRFFGQGLR